LATKSDPARPFVKPKTEFGNRILSKISWGDIVPSPMSKLWAGAIALESEPYLDLLERILYRGIETATGAWCARLSGPVSRATRSTLMRS